jgi:hypothetical protein
MRPLIGLVIICSVIGSLALAIASAANVSADTIIPGDYNVTGKETWDAAGSPYVVQGNLTVKSTGQLTITAGVEVQIAADRHFVVQNGGTLVVTGNSGDPVVIASISENFYALRFDSGANAQLEHCDIRHAGAHAYVPIDIYASNISIDHCNIHDNGVGSVYTLRIFGAGLSPTISNTIIQNNAGQVGNHPTRRLVVTFLPYLHRRAAILKEVYTTIS